MLRTDIKLQTNANGQFRFVDVPAGQYLLIVRRLGFRPISAIVEVARGDTAAEELLGARQVTEPRGDLPAGERLDGRQRAAAAAELLDLGGPEAVTLREIGARMGIDPVTDRVLEAGPLRLVVKYGTGLDNIDLEREREREEVALSVLLGRSPRQVFEGNIKVRDAVDEAPGAPVVPSGMPSELLLRRPDLVEAERRLGAMNARVAAARAELQWILKADPQNAHHIAAPMPGLVVTVTVAPGEHVEKGQKLFTLEAMKMETTVYAELTGKVTVIAFEPGTKVKAGDLLVQQDISAETAQLRSAEAAVALARVTLERSKKMLADKVVPEANYDNAEAQMKQAQAQADQDMLSR